MGLRRKLIANDVKTIYRSDTDNASEVHTRTKIVAHLLFLSVLPLLLNNELKKDYWFHNVHKQNIGIGELSIHECDRTLQ